MTTMNVRRCKTKSQLLRGTSQGSETWSEGKAKRHRQSRRPPDKSCATTAVVGRYGLDAGLKALASREGLVQMAPPAAAVSRCADNLIELTDPRSFPVLYLHGP